MPTVGLPGMRSIRIDSACRPRHRSSVSVVMRLYLMPASGLNSNVVTTGPGLICTTLPSTLNSSNLDLMRAGDFLQLQPNRMDCAPGTSFSKSVEGRRYAGCSAISGREPWFAQAAGLGSGSGSIGTVPARLPGRTGRFRGSWSSSAWIGISSRARSGSSIGCGALHRLTGCADGNRLRLRVRVLRARLAWPLSRARCSARSRARAIRVAARAIRPSACEESTEEAQRYPRASLATIAIENLEIRYSERIRQMPVSRTVPSQVERRAAANRRARCRPRRPPKMLRSTAARRAGWRARSRCSGTAATAPMHFHRGGLDGVGAHPFPSQHPQQHRDG